MLYSAVHPDADLVLVPGATVAAGYLQDSAGGWYPVDQLGESIVRRCVDPLSWSGLLASMKSSSAASAVEVERGLQRYVLQLHDRKLLSIHQSFLRELLWELILWPFDVMAMIFSRQSPIRRFSSRRIYRPTVAALIRAVLESQVFVTLSALVLTVAAIVATSVFMPLTPQLTVSRSAILGLIISGVCGLTLSAAFVHELAHLLVARMLGLPVVGVQARRGAASVLLGGGSPTHLRLALVAGPIAGSLFCAIAAVLLLGVLDPGWVLLETDNVRLTLAILALVLGSAQVLNLTPLFADGKAIRVASKAIAGSQDARA